MATATIVAAMPARRNPRGNGGSSEGAEVGCGPCVLSWWFSFKDVSPDYPARAADAGAAGAVLG